MSYLQSWIQGWNSLCWILKWTPQKLIIRCCICKRTDQLSFYKSLININIFNCFYSWFFFTSSIYFYFDGKSLVEIFWLIWNSLSNDDDKEKNQLNKINKKKYNLPTYLVYCVNRISIKSQKKSSRLFSRRHNIYKMFLSI